MSQTVFVPGGSGLLLLATRTSCGLQLSIENFQGLSEAASWSRRNRVRALVEVDASQVHLRDCVVLGILDRDVSLTSGTILQQLTARKVVLLDMHLRERPCQSPRPLGIKAVQSTLERLEGFGFVVLDRNPKPASEWTAILTNPGHQLVTQLSASSFTPH